MPTNLRPLIAVILVGLSLAACDPRAEEEASLSADQDLTPAEIIQRILDAEKSIESVREDRTDVSTQVASPSNESPSMEADESRSVRIQVGDDAYIKYEFVLPDDFCAGDPECLETFNPLDESLYYRETRYYRDRSGTKWALESEDSCDDPSAACAEVPIQHVLGTDAGTGGFVECPALEAVIPTEFSQVYSFEFSWLKDPQRIESLADDAGLIQIRGNIDESFWAFGLSPEVEAAYAECGVDPTEIFPASLRDYIPDRYTGTADVWVDPATFFVRRLEWSLDSSNGDRHLQSDKTVSLYSQFNEAELPGPLPD